MEDSQKNDGRLTFLAVGAALGIAIAAAAWLWAALESPQTAWPAERAKALQAAYDALHAARGDGGPAPPDDVALQKAQAVADRLEADLEQARNFRGTWATRIAAGGLALTIACGLGYLALRGR